MQKGSAKSKPRKYLMNRAEVARRLHLSWRSVCKLFRGEESNLGKLKEVGDLVLEELRMIDRRWRKGNLKSIRGIRHRKDDLH